MGFHTCFWPWLKPCLLKVLSIDSGPQLCLGVQERPGLVVLTIELEKALSQTSNNMQPTKTWSPYRDPLAKFLNKYSKEVLSDITSSIISTLL